MLVIGFVLFSAMGKDPWQALYVFFIEPIDTVYDIGELLLKASPIMLVAIGLSVGYRANVWNIGAEGQLIMGAIFGGGVALALHGAESSLVLSLLVHDAWRDPEGFNFPQSKMFNESALLPNLLEGTRLNVGFIVALAVVAAGGSSCRRATRATRCASPASRPRRRTTPASRRRAPCGSAC